MFEVNLNSVGLAVAILFYGTLCAYLLRKSFAEGLRRLRALPRMVQVVMVVMVAIATVEAQKRRGGGGGAPTVSAEDILRCYRLAFVTNDAMHDHAMPANAQRLGNVHVHGAASSWGRNILDFSDWSFPLGTNETAHSRLWWFVDGRLRAAPHDAASEISAGARGALAV